MLQCSLTLVSAQPSRGVGDRDRNLWGEEGGWVGGQQSPYVVLLWPLLWQTLPKSTRAPPPPASCSLGSPLPPSLAPETGPGQGSVCP